MSLNKNITVRRTVAGGAMKSSRSPPPTTTNGDPHPCREAEEGTAVYWEGTGGDGMNDDENIFLSETNGRSIRTNEITRRDKGQGAIPLEIAITLHRRDQNFTTRLERII